MIVSTYLAWHKQMTNNILKLPIEVRCQIWAEVVDHWEHRGHGCVRSICPCKASISSVTYCCCFHQIASSAGSVNGPDNGAVPGQSSYLRPSMTNHFTRELNFVLPALYTTCRQLRAEVGGLMTAIPSILRVCTRECLQELLSVAASRGVLLFILGRVQLVASDPAHATQAGKESHPRRWP